MTPDKPPPTPPQQPPPTDEILRAIAEFKAKLEQVVRDLDECDTKIKAAADVLANMARMDRR